MKIRPFFNLISVGLITVLLPGCEPKEEIEVRVQDYHALVDKVTAIMVNDIFSPPQASRVYVYPNIAAYEALNTHSGNYKSLVPQLNGFNDHIELPAPGPDTNLELAALLAYMQVAEKLVFSEDIIRTHRDSLKILWSRQNRQSLEKAEAYASRVAAGVIAWMESDQCLETRSMPLYDFFDEQEGRWKPTPPAYLKGIEPHWARIRPMVLDSSSQFKPAPPPVFSLEKDSEFYRQLYEVYEISEAIRATGNESREMEIARFWDCNPYVSITRGHYMFAEKKITPGAHWMGICKIASIKSGANFDTIPYMLTPRSPLHSLMPL